MSTDDEKLEALSERMIVVECVDPSTATAKRISAAVLVCMILWAALFVAANLFPFAGNPAFPSGYAGKNLENPKNTPANGIHLEGKIP